MAELQTVYDMSFNADKNRERTSDKSIGLMMRANSDHNHDPVSIRTCDSVATKFPSGTRHDGVVSPLGPSQKTQFTCIKSTGIDTHLIPVY